MQKAASSLGTSARSGGDALVPAASSSPPPLPPPPPRVSPPPSAAASKASGPAASVVSSVASKAGAGPGAGAGAPAKRPKSPDQQRTAWAQAAANCARLHHIAMWRHRWLGYGWGETAGAAARIKKIEQRRRKNEIMKQLLRHIDQNELASSKHVSQRNHNKSVSSSTQHCNGNGTATTPQPRRSSGHSRPRDRALKRGDKLISVIYRQLNRKNSPRPQTQHTNRVEKSSPTQQTQRSSSNAQAANHKQHESRNEKTSHSDQRVRSSSNAGSTKLRQGQCGHDSFPSRQTRSSNDQPANQRQHKSRKETTSHSHQQVRSSSNAGSPKPRQGQCSSDSFPSRHDNRKSSPARRRHHSSDNSAATTQSQRQCRDKRSVSSVRTRREASPSPQRREKSSSTGGKSRRSTSVSPQIKCKKESTTKQSKQRSDEKSHTVTQTGRLGREDHPKTTIPKQRNRSNSVETPSQLVGRNHMEITLSAPNLACSHTTSTPKRSRCGNCSDATESTGRQSHPCSRAFSDSRLQVHSPDRRSSEIRLRELYTNIKPIPNQPNNVFCNKMPLSLASLRRNAEKAQPWEYRTDTRFRSSWWRHRRPYLVSTTTQTTRHRHNPKAGNLSLRRRSDEASVRTASTRRSLENAARTSHIQERNHERSTMPGPSSCGGAANARTCQTQSQKHKWANIPPSPRDRSPASFSPQSRRGRHDNRCSMLRHHGSRVADVPTRQNQRNPATPRQTDQRRARNGSVSADVRHAWNIYSRATQTKSQRSGRGSRTFLRCRDAAVMTTQPKLWRLDTGTAMKPPAMKEDASSTAALPSAVDLSLSIFLQILRQPLVAAAAAAAVAAAAGANGRGAPAETQPSAAVGAGDSATPAAAPPPCKLPEE